jgi:tetratricopeptide (TPR) repeat protein
VPRASSVLEGIKAWLQGKKFYSEAFAERGSKIESAQRYEQALECIDRALHLGFENAEVHQTRGICLRSLEYDYDAIEAFNDAILMNGDDCNSFYFRSISKSMVLDYEGALADIKSAIQLSKRRTVRNDIYNSNARKSGHRNGVIEMYESYLGFIRIGLEQEERERAITNPEMLAVFRERKRKRLEGLKRRS